MGDLAQPGSPWSDASPQPSSDQQRPAAVGRLTTPSAATEPRRQASTPLPPRLQPVQLDVSLGPEGDADDAVLMGTPDHEGCCSSLLLASPPAGQQDPGGEDCPGPIEGQASDAGVGSGEGTEPGSPASSR